ncbi:unnamed protein product [Rotaria sp. Silwood2]|nr:unnamed protein product [Rotaria sp. Silwood2]CAF2816626.1 unnamed protein product [Rotaria sp. Silwood2]CAF3132040.1 unnamed protein product [Rotaria sp. Silwood2]CAF3215354.1 unnamed protein product [Rotaria sp. Silwood2]CAF4175288.1 unnamed protein product [Rotaria sp. Silwood2]
MSLPFDSYRVIAQLTTSSPSLALATCNSTLCKSPSLPCSSNLDCECFSLTKTVNTTTSGICGVAGLSCTSMVRCNSDNVTCSIAQTICVNSTRCQQPVCYPMPLANIQICPPSTRSTSTATTSRTSSTTIRTTTKTSTKTSTTIRTTTKTYTTTSTTIRTTTKTYTTASTTIGKNKPHGFPSKS